MQAILRSVSALRALSAACVAGENDRNLTSASTCSSTYAIKTNLGQKINIGLQDGVGRGVGALRKNVTKSAKRQKMTCCVFFDL